MTSAAYGGSKMKTGPWLLRVSSITEGSWDGCWEECFKLSLRANDRGLKVLRLHCLYEYPLSMRSLSLLARLLVQCWCMLVLCLTSKGEELKEGVRVSYQLPATGVLPQTYRVTLAVVDKKKPEWIISQFAAGVVRTVTAENKGKFSEVWNGLDDNFMPVPPGTYGVKGIFMPAQKWEVDGEYHSITPR